MEFSLSQKIEANKTLNSKKIIEFINEKLDYYHRAPVNLGKLTPPQYKILKKTDTELQIKAAVSTGKVMFMNLAGYTATFKVKTEGKKARVEVTGSTYKNGNYIFIALFGLVTLAPWLYLFAYAPHSAKRKQFIETLLKDVENEFAAI